MSDLSKFIEDSKTFQGKVLTTLENMERQREEDRESWAHTCQEHKTWTVKIQRDVEQLQNWRTFLVGCWAAVMAYFKIKGKI